MPRPPAVTVKNWSGHSKYRVRGFLLAEALATTRINNVEYCDVAGIRLRRTNNFNYLKIILKYLDFFRHTYEFPLCKEVFLRPVRI